MSKRKSNTLQTNSRLFYAHVYSYHFIFCANEGAAKTACASSCPRSLAIWAPPSSRVYFLSSTWTVVDFISPDLVEVFLTMDRGGRRRGCLGRGGPLGAAASGFCELGGRSSRWEVRGDGRLSMLSYSAVYNSRLLLLWRSFLTQFFGGNAIFWSLKNLILYQ